METCEAATSICNSKGELLFYTNGEHVYNKEHNVMPANLPGKPSNRIDVYGGISTTQIMALPMPLSESLYYIIYADHWGVDDIINGDTIKNMYFAIIDMSLEGGLGRVIAKMEIIHSNACEKVAATQHCNGRDWWIVTHELGE